jgi:hypothetical protein
MFRVTGIATLEINPTSAQPLRGLETFRIDCPE